LHSAGLVGPKQSYLQLQQRSSVNDFEGNMGREYFVEIGRKDEKSFMMGQWDG
jgi:hypothetical protein